MWIGYTLNGVRHGPGKIEFPDGSYYNGEWENDKSNGYGELVIVEKIADIKTGAMKHHILAKYNGQWKDDKQHGYGKEFW